MVAITEDDRLRNINNALETTARDMYRDREIDEGQLRSSLRLAGRSDAEIEGLVALAVIERTRPRRVPRGLMERAFVEKFIPLGRLREYYEAEGFALDDRILLEEMAVAKRLQHEADEERAKKEAEKDTFRDLPRAQVENAYITGVVSRARVLEYYTERAFSPEDASVLIALADQRKAEHDRRQEELAAAALEPDFVKLPRGVMEEAFIRDVIDESRLANWYRERGFDPNEIPTLLGLVKQKREARRERLADQLKAAEGPGFRELPRSVMEEAFIRGRVDESRLREWYEAQRFRPAEIPILLDLVRGRKLEREAKAASTTTKPPA